MDGSADSMDASLSKLLEIMKDREGCSPWGHQDWTRLSRLNNNNKKQQCFPNGSDCKDSAMQETSVQSLGREDPWRREWLPITVFLPGKLVD